MKLSNNKNDARGTGEERKMPVVRSGKNPSSVAKREEGKSGAQTIRSQKKHDKKKRLVTRKIVIGRSYVALLLILSIFALVVYQLVSLQIVDKDDNKDRALNQYVRESTIYPK
ncbi:MAG: hypothetical protein IJS94_00555, partial [Clostridia bacterium]|nr:hypothetical protein [Clostridia bacterium]